MLQFGVLGPLEVRSGDQSLPLQGARRRALLAYLLVHAGESRPLDHIVDDLWAESRSPGSPSTVQTYVSHFRKLFDSVQGDVHLVHRAGGYLLELPAGALDASRFEASVAAASAEVEPARRQALIAGALELWRGAPLVEFAGQPWADEPTRLWTRLYVLAQQLRTAALLDTGNHRDARSALEVLVGSYPLHEPFWEQLVVARYRCGEPADALAALHEARSVLTRELGVQPGPALVALERQVLDHDAALEGPTGVPTLGGAISTSIEPLPTGVVTFLLTDIEASTRQWDQHPDAMAKALARHEEVVSEVVGTHAGHLLKWRGEGDSTLSVFARATDACVAAIALQRQLISETWPAPLDLQTRVALHSGEAQLRDGDYYGGVLNRGARLRALATGGEIVLSRTTRDLVADVLPQDVALIDAGVRQIAGLRRHEHLYLIEIGYLPTHGSRLSLLDRARHDAGRDLIGRAGAVEQALAALRVPGLVTITGPGGIGKTSLMREICVRVAGGDDGFERVVAVELVGAHDGIAVESVVLDALTHDAGAAVRPPLLGADNRPEDALVSLVAAIGRDRVLLSIDNCEHVLDSVADVVDALVSRCPSVSVLATSREPLSVPRERLVPLGPLQLPDDRSDAVDDIVEVDSMRLLLARARDAGRDLPLTPATTRSLVAVCRALDGVPLALELAAARLRTTTPEDLLERITDQQHVLEAKRGDPRHRSLHTAIDWSYRLLDDAQRRMLRHLSIFVGGFTLDAAERLCADEPDVRASPAVVYLNLAELVSKSLVMLDPDTHRYRILEPIRVYARGKLEEQDETSVVARRHATWVLHGTRATLIDQSRGQPDSALAWRAELDNVHAALDWLDANGERQMFLGIVAALGFTWLGTVWRRGLAAATRAVELLDGVPPFLRASVLLSRGIVEQRVDLYGSRRWLEEARTSFAEAEHPIGVAWATYFLGRAYLIRDNATARRQVSEALAIFHELEQPFAEAWALMQLGSIEELEGDLEVARTRFEQALAVTSDPAMATLRGVILAELADNSLAQGDIAQARRQLRDAIELEQHGGDLYNLAGDYTGAAWVEVVAGDLTAARSLLVEAFRRGLEIENTWQLSEALIVLAVVLFEANRPTDARRAIAATGWDRDPPQGLMDLERSLATQAFRRLEPIVETAEDRAADEGRQAGLIATVRSFLAEMEPS